MSNKVNIKVLVSDNNFKVLSISGASGDLLKRHKVDESGLLLVQHGSLTYKENNKEVVLVAGEGYSIPPNVFHQVRCNSDSAAFVVIPQQTKMMFQK